MLEGLGVTVEEIACLGGGDWVGGRSVGGSAGGYNVKVYSVGG